LFCHQAVGRTKKHAAGFRKKNIFGGAEEFLSANKKAGPCVQIDYNILKPWIIPGEFDYLKYLMKK
jgi:hypothetical protein